MRISGPSGNEFQADAVGRSVYENFGGGTLHLKRSLHAKKGLIHRSWFGRRQRDSTAIVIPTTSDVEVEIDLEAGSWLARLPESAGVPQAEGRVARREGFIVSAIARPPIG